MNKLIKELMDQAFEGIQVVDEIEEHHLEKFAELIVRECISIVSQTVSGKPVDDLKEHFGVER